eukprot:6893613-Ditylum_brightwellii.AAC.1
MCVEQVASLGWSAAFKGFLVPEWRYTQAASLTEQQSKHSAKWLVAALIQKLWDVAWDMWQHQNHI